MVQEEPKVFFQHSLPPTPHLDMSGSEWDDDDPQMTMYRLAASRLGHIKADGNPVTAEEILRTTRRLHSQLREQREEIWNDEDAVEVRPTMLNPWLRDC